VESSKSIYSPSNTTKRESWVLTVWLGGVVVSYQTVWVRSDQRSTVGKLTVGLASHITDSSVYTGSRPQGISTTLIMAQTLFRHTLKVHPSLNSTTAVFLVASSCNHSKDVRNKSCVTAKIFAKMLRGCYAGYGPVEFKLKLKQYN